MSCCGGNCGCGANCKCGNGCSGCNMYPGLEETKSTATQTLITGFAGADSKREFEEAGPGSANETCKCGPNCSCNPCKC